MPDIDGIGVLADAMAGHSEGHYYLIQFLYLVVESKLGTQDTWEKESERTLNCFSFLC